MMPTPEERADTCLPQFYGDRAHWIAKVAAVIREAVAEAVAAERERAVQAVLDATPVSCCCPDLYVAAIRGQQAGPAGERGRG